MVIHCYALQARVKGTVGSHVRCVAPVGVCDTAPNRTYLRGRDCV